MTFLEQPMFDDVFRFSFSREVPVDEAESTLHLAAFAVEGIYGNARVRLDFSYKVDPERRLLFVDGNSDVGRTIAQVFTGLLLREFGDDAFRVDRTDSQPTEPCETAAA